MERNDLELKDLGWNTFFEAQFAEVKKTDLVPARVVEEFQGLYKVRAARGEYLAKVSGRVRYEAEQRDDMPAVGDWVAVTPRPTEGRARIEAILARRTKLSRKAAGREVEEQIVATNLDTVFIVSSLNQEFNLRRIERYLTLVWDSGARPVLLLNKADLCADAAAWVKETESVALGAPVHLLSARQGQGVETLREYLGQGQTAAFVGSSGVGKSTIINTLSGNSAIKTQTVRESDDRGRHTTTTRQMMFLPGGGIVIDTPGMRELQLWDSEEHLAQTFADITALAAGCKFRDCAHNGEPGCAVTQAVQNGTLDAARVENHHKLQAEMRFQQRKVDPQAARALKEQWKKVHKAARDPRFPF